MGSVCAGRLVVPSTLSTEKAVISGQHPLLVGRAVYICHHPARTHPPCSTYILLESLLYVSVLGEHPAEAGGGGGPWGRTEVWGRAPELGTHPEAQGSAEAMIQGQAVALTQVVRTG